MRLAVLADIHGNLPALEAVLEDARQYGVAGFIVAGDLTGGPQPLETLHLLRSLGTGTWIIQGNSDINLLRYATNNVPESWHTSLQYALLRWGHQHVDEEALAFIRALPEQAVVSIKETDLIRIVHGSPRDPYEGINPNADPDLLDRALAETDEPVLVCGHDHIPWQRKRDRRLALNPGAVCGPLNGDTRAQYAWLTWQDAGWQVKHRAVPYDLGRIRTAFQNSGLLEQGGALAKAFLLSIETGQNVGLDLLSYAYRLMANVGMKECEVIPDEVWEQAVATFDWDAAVNLR